MHAARSARDACAVLRDPRPAPRWVRDGAKRWHARPALTWLEQPRDHRRPGAARFLTSVSSRAYQSVQSASAAWEAAATVTERSVPSSASTRSVSSLVVRPARADPPAAHQPDEQVVADPPMHGLGAEDDATLRSSDLL